MNAEELTKVVDHVADKIRADVVDVKPLARETVKQYVRAEILDAIRYLLAAIFFTGLIAVAYFIGMKQPFLQEAASGWQFAWLAACVATGVFALAINLEYAFDSLKDATQPNVKLLKR